MSYADGVLFVAENPSKALHKVSEIYDRIGFAAVGRYNEFENLRVAGVRMADLRGYSYDRRDVTGRASPTRSRRRSARSSPSETKPYEVEICIAEVGADPGRRPALPAHLRRLRSQDEPEFLVMGGQADAIVDRAERDGHRRHVADRRARSWRSTRSARVGGEGGKPRTLDATSSRSRCSTAPGRAASSAGIAGAALTPLLEPADERRRRGPPGTVDPAQADGRRRTARPTGPSSRLRDGRHRRCRPTRSRSRPRTRRRRPPASA